jgi:hypothetical protein
MITKKRIDILFKDLWPKMKGCEEHHNNCLKQYSLIEKLFILHGRNWNKLLIALDSLDGIGITIASGLIWAAYPNKAVPFDKYTTTYCLNEKWIKTEKVSNDYINICKTIKIELDKWCWTDGHPFTIEDLVREARDRMEHSEWFTEPL